MNDRPPSHGERNLGTLIALAALVLASFGFLLLISTVLPQVMWLVVVVVGFFLLGLFHYFTWGRWLSRMTAQDEDEGE